MENWKTPPGRDRSRRAANCGLMRTSWPCSTSSEPVGAAERQKVLDVRSDDCECVDTAGHPSIGGCGEFANGAGDRRGGGVGGELAGHSAEPVDTEAS